MIFTPHTLSIKSISKPSFDESRNPIPVTEKWVELCKCRADDNGSTKQIAVNGSLHAFSYHIVYKGDKIQIDTEVECKDKNGAVRCRGKVLKSSICNRLNYAEIWI